LTLSLEPGTRLDADAVRGLRGASLVREAMARALSLLSRSRHTTRALSLKLQRRGFEAPVIERTIERLTELGYLDDEEAARSWLAHRMERHPAGRGALLAALLRHGVPRETAERVVGAGLPPEAEAEAARRVLRRMYPSEGSRAELDREPGRSVALRKLLARGFSRQSARLALRGRGADDVEQ
jgi:SOS response regulatory protein OraA/RecX